MGSMFSSDTRTLRALGRQLRDADRVLYREVQRGLRAEGEKVAARARSNASDLGISRVVDPIRVSAAGLNGVKVSAGKKGGPAAAFEHKGASGRFRHPVFGNLDVWVDQDARPFLLRAAVEKLDESAAGVRDVLVVKVEQVLHGQSVYI